MAKADEDRAPAEGALTIPESMTASGEQPDAPVATDRDRRDLAARVGLNPISLVGSWFIRVENGTAIWWGIIVGEVQSGYYLCEVDSGEGYKDKPQVICDLEQMQSKEDGYEWRFYNTEDAMREAYTMMERKGV